MSRNLPKNELGKGQLLARLLAGCWRSGTGGQALPGNVGPHVDLDDAFATLILKKNVAPLLWWQWKHGPLANSPLIYPFRQTYRFHNLKAMQHEADIVNVFHAFREAGIEPILCKGWAVARLYPDPGLRPFDDLDICVAPDQLDAAKAVLTQVQGQFGSIDLHCGLPDLKDRSWQHLWEHSRLVELNGCKVRILGAEDQLRHLCLHFWRHLGHKPLWLCDIAVSLEQLPDGFDWDYFQSGHARLTDWTMSVAALACKLLGAQIPHDDLCAKVRDLPDWLASSILWRWGAVVEKQPLLHYCKHVGELADALLYRWFNPMRAMLRMRLPTRRALPMIQFFSICAWPLMYAVRVHRSVRGVYPLREGPFDLHVEKWA